MSYKVIRADRVALKITTGKPLSPSEEELASKSIHCRMMKVVCHPKLLEMHAKRLAGDAPTAAEQCWFKQWIVTVPEQLEAIQKAS